MGRDFPADSPIQIRVGPVQVTVTMESVAAVIERYHPEAVVSSDDTGLSHSGGVSAAIAELAGPEYSRALAEVTPLDVGDVAVTAAGALPLRYVLHAVTLDLHKPVQATERTIRSIARQLFTRCEALGIRSIAIPAIGAGTASLPAAVSAEVVADTLVSHVRGTTVLEHVIFTVPNEAIHALFVSDVFDQMARDPAAPRQSRDYSDTNAALDRSPEFNEAQRRAREASAPDGVTAPRSRWWHSVLPGRRERNRSQAPTQTLSEADAGAPKLVSPPPRREAQEFAAQGTRPLLDGRYVLLEELGRGGFAIVYLAWDLVLRRTVAIKRLRSDLSASDSLWREAAVALDLAHEGVVRVLHYEPRVSSGGPFLVQEHVTWPTGEEWIADAGNTPLPTAVVLGIGLKLCDTLAFAHGHGVLHLDIKPGNVFVDPAGERAKLADFGLARILERGSPTAVLLRGSGTPRYMAPEQWQSGSRVAATTDIYQLAATLWDFLTGEPPDQRDGVPAGIDKVRFAVLKAVEEGLSTDPTSRPATAREFAARLTAAA